MVAMGLGRGLLCRYTDRMSHGLRSPTNARLIIIASALTIAVALCYAQTARHQFVNYDDHRYITMNPRVQQGLTLDNLRLAFTTFEVANWHPLTWLAHMLDCDLFRVRDDQGNVTQWAGGHHLVNVLLHAANAALLAGRIHL